MAPPDDDDGDGTARTLLGPGVVTPPAVDATGETIAGAPPPEPTDGWPRASTLRRGGAGGGRQRGASLTDVIGGAAERLREVDPGHYVRLEELARGGLGRIHLARDERTGRIVALKELLRPGEALAIRLAREAIITAHLEHPSIVPVYEAGRWPGGAPFFAMKRVHGESLEERVRRTPLAADRLALIPHVLDLADALAFAHTEGVIHRDLKPANVLIGDFGETVVIDWGLAKNLRTGEEAAPAPTSRLAAAAGETVVGSVMGTPAYMPPEQARGDVVDEHADVYALGAVLYHVLAGEPPYGGMASADAILEAVQAGPPISLALKAPGTPAELVAIADKAMAPRPAERYASARELAEDLRRFQNGHLVAAHRYSAWQHVRRFVRSHRAALATASVAALALLAFAIVSVGRIADQRDVARRERSAAVRSRGEAQAARGEAERRLVELQVELGRQAIAAGDAGRALAFLVGAVRGAPDDEVARVLASRALAAYGSTVAIVPGHAPATLSAALTPDGATLLTAGADERLVAWDPARATPRWQVAGPAIVRLTPDGALAVAYTGKAELLALRVADGAVQGRVQFGDRSEGIKALALSPDGSRALVGGERGTVATYALPGLDPVASVAGAAAIAELAIAPDGALAASIGADGRVGLWRPRDGASVGGFAAHRGPAHRVLFGAGGLVTAGDDGAVRLWTQTGGRLRELAHAKGLYGLALAPDGVHLATSAVADPIVRVWDLASAAPPRELPGHDKGVPDLRYTPDGRGLVTIDEDGQLRAFDAATLAPWQAPPVDGTILSAAVVAPDRLVVAGLGATRVVRIEPDPLAPPLVGHRARVRAVVSRPDGEVVSGAEDGTIRRWLPARASGPLPIRRLEPGPVLEAGAPVIALGVSDDGGLLVSGHQDGAVKVWTLPGLTLVRALAGHSGKVRLARVEGDRLVTGAEDGVVRLWDLASGAALGAFDTGGPVLAARLGAGGTRLVTERVDGQTAIWDVARGARVDDGKLPPSSLTSVPLDPRGELTAVGTSFEVHLVALGDGKVVRTVERAKVFTVAWTNDGETLALAQVSGEIWLHDAATGAPRRSIRADPSVTIYVRALPELDAIVGAVGAQRRIRLFATGGQLLAEGPPFAADVLVLEPTADGAWLVGGALDGGLVALALAPWTGDGDALARLAACVSPWRLVGGTAVERAPIEPARCPVAPR
jgi:serine/threonine protein kinase/WD40 repeat protein